MCPARLELDHRRSYLCLESNPVKLQEISTGKAYQKSKDAVLQASERLQTLAEPHVSKARVAIEPMLAAVMVKLRPVWESINSQLQKDQYKTIVNFVADFQHHMLKAWLTARQAVAGVYQSDAVRTETPAGRLQPNQGIPVA